MVNTHNNSPDYEKLVEEIDEILVKAFYECGLESAEIEPLRCYLMLKMILNDMGNFSPGMQIADVEMQIRTYIGDENLEKVKRLATDLATKVRTAINEDTGAINPT